MVMILVKRPKQDESQWRVVPDLPKAQRIHIKNPKNKSVYVVYRLLNDDGSKTLKTEVADSNSEAFAIAQRVQVSEKVVPGSVEILNSIEYERRKEIEEVKAEVAQHYALMGGENKLFK